MIDINELTFGQLKEIRSLMPDLPKEEKPHPFVGKFCIARAYSEGVHAGFVVSVDNDTCILRDSRRLHSWKGTGVALSGVANGELISGNVDTINPEIYITGLCSLIPCTEKAMKSIYEKK
jgi:hypothetical protein